jgi:hypothetical protein
MEYGGRFQHLPECSSKTKNQPEHSNIFQNVLSKQEPKHSNIIWNVLPKFQHPECSSKVKKLPEIPKSSGIFFQNKEPTRTFQHLPEYSLER